MDLYDIRNQLNGGKSIYDLHLRVTFYARVSTDKDEQLHSLQAQIQYYSDLITGTPNWTFVDGYIDEGISGTSVKKRESFLNMIEDARLKKFDFIITKEISRFSRNTVDSIQYTQQLLSYGVGVLFQSDNINTLMPDSELRLTIMSSIAQDEVRKTSERVKFGFKRAIEKGVVLGNNRIWGYVKDNGRLVVVEKEAKLIQKIFTMYAVDGLGMRSICNWLTEHGIKNTKGNDFSFSTIKGILTNPKYKGYYCGGKTHKYDYKLSNVRYLDPTEWKLYKDETGSIVPAIVSEELWEKANSILQTRSARQSAENKTSYQNQYSFSGKVICTEHQTPYYRACYRYPSGSKEVWQCRKYTEQGKAGCNSPIVYTSELNEALRQVVGRVVHNQAGIMEDLIGIYSEIDSQSNVQAEILRQESLVYEISQKKDKLLDLSMKGRLSDNEFEVRNNQFNVELSDLQNRIAGLRQQEAQNRGQSLPAEELRGLIAEELNFEDGFNNQIVDSLLERIEVDHTDQKNEIRLKIILKVIPEKLLFLIRRARSETSVCYIPYI
ncbi:recombinase family protein [Marasmitruncus massiliensis]|uniref:recombinase family protein n=1 Tax=Marasmitruncus massiliensis TaxID=1944642 RepID=UPI000C7AE9A2|nr:recombinase family protein [Marasmitruncus massiliensis]